MNAPLTSLPLGKHFHTSHFFKSGGPRNRTVRPFPAATLLRVSPRRTAPTKASLAASMASLQTRQAAQSPPGRVGGRVDRSGAYFLPASGNDSGAASVAPFPRLVGGTPSFHDSEVRNLEQNILRSSDPQIMAPSPLGTTSRSSKPWGLEPDFPA